MVEEKEKVIRSKNRLEGGIGMMGHKDRLVTWDEQDVVYDRSTYKWRSGVAKRLKNKINRRSRRKAKELARMKGNGDD